jgi:hypothetical protein
MTVQPGAAKTVYRIVQEALTNALKARRTRRPDRGAAHTDNRGSPFPRHPWVSKLLAPTKAA